MIKVDFPQVKLRIGLTNRWRTPSGDNPGPRSLSSCDSVSPTSWLLRVISLPVHAKLAEGEELTGIEQQQKNRKLCSVPEALITKSVVGKKPRLLRIWSRIFCFEELVTVFEFLKCS